MSNREHNEEFMDGNIEKTYDELTKVVNAKNDIKNNITLSIEEFNRNEIELEQLGDLLHDIRIKITSNPILRELNIANNEEAVLQRKLAESIYLELPDISSRLDVYQENFSKFNEEYIQVQKLHSVIQQKLENKINTMSSSKVDLKNKYEEQLKNFEQEISRESQELTDIIENMTVKIAEENNIAKSLSYEVKSKKYLFHKLSQMNEHNLVDFNQFESKLDEKDSNKLLNEKENELEKEVVEMRERTNFLRNKMNELKQQKSSHEVTRTELYKIIYSQQSLLRKKVLHTCIQHLKSVLKKRTEEIHHFKENILKQQNFFSDIELNFKLCETGINDTADEINKQKHIYEQQVKDRKDINEKRETLEKHMKKLEENLSVLLENKNKEELSINISIEKENFLLSEINKIKENICATEVVTKELNEKISKIQDEIDEREKKDQETASYEEVEKDNNVLDLKIRRYIKAIEICKRKRAVNIEKKRDFKNFSDSSQDSMLLPKKKK